MFKIYTTASSIFKRKNCKNQTNYRHLTTTTGFLSHSHIHTGSSDNTHTCNSKIKLLNTSRHNCNSYDLSGNAKQLNYCLNNKHNKTSYSTSHCKSTSNHYEMRKLKMKVHKFVNLKNSKVCNLFEYKNNNLYHKLNEHFKSERFIKKYVNYHHNFHFNKNNLGHDKCNMIINLKNESESTKHLTKQIKNEFQNAFTEKEKKAILLNPVYYIPNKQLNIKLGIFKSNKLSDKLNTEDEYKKRIHKEKKTQVKKRKNRKRFMTVEHKQILDEITQLKDSQLRNIKLGIENKRAESRKATLLDNNNNKQQQQNQNKIYNHKRHKSETERKGKVNKLHIEIDHLIKKAVNKDHDERISNYFKTCREKDVIEKELVNCCSKIMNINKKKYPVIPIVKEDNLTEVCKKEYCLMLNKEQLSKIENFIKKEKHEENFHYSKQQENQLMNYYVTQVKEQYEKNTNNNHKSAQK